MQKRIAIIGAGPGGATLARVLQRHGIECQIFEKEVSLEARDQGGSLDMKLESGQEALKIAGLHDEFMKLAYLEGQDTRVMDQNGAIRLEEKAQGSYMPEIERGVLRRLLIDSLSPGTISWGREITQTESLLNEFDLVVGADGAWSKVRSLLSKTSPVYSGVFAIESNFSDVDNSHTAVAKTIGRGTFFAIGNNRAIFAHRNGSAHIRAYFALRDSLESVIAKDPTILHSDLLERFHGWSENLKAIIASGPGPLVVRPVYILPVPHLWEHRDGLTLLGDAAHLMSPFSGAGANLAMLDAAELGLAIISNSDLREYETKMIARGIHEGKAAGEAMEATLNENGIESFMALMQSHGQ
jgi:2-polyprenyl-6-methoxyphenol hydroxylase-like FAD-dependent oxidoreductase